MSEQSVTRGPVERQERWASGWMTEELSFRSGGDRCAATLYRPTEGGAPAPGVVMAQGFSLTRWDGAPRYAESFARAGFAVLTFDYRYFGDSTGEPRQLVDRVYQRADVAAAVAFARSLDGIDPERVALWGYSLGGGHVLHLAAEDPGLAAGILHFPLVDGLAAVRLAGVRSSLRLFGATFGALVRRRLVDLPVTGPPGTLAMLTKEEAEPGFAALRASGSHWRNEFLARPNQPMSSFRPVKVATEVRCPLLACVGERDTIVPGAPIARTAKRAPRCELRHYDTGHFDPFLEGFDPVLTDQVDFLDRHLRAGATR
jgi:pimeloyl-ACP methyl ester carboxylesterase